MSQLKSLFPTLSLLAFLIAVTAGFVASYHAAPPSATIKMPLRVMTTQNASVTLHVSNATGVTRMYIKGHQMGYHWGEGGMISFRVNGGPWTPINNGIATCEQPERARGCIGGDYHTIRFTMPVSGIVAGANTIAFRHNNAVESLNFGGQGSTTFDVKVRSTARILEIDLRTASGASRVTDTFVFEDLATDPGFRIPAGFNDATSIAQGRTLWESGVLKADDRPGAPRLQAACKDCHTANGYDLQYFGYHNEVIINRSLFHGLTENQGKKIAAYIRSTHQFTPYARPWTPTYQPGPGVDDSDPLAWAAGAGLDAVLRTDAEMEPYLFPKGRRDWNRYSTTQTLNVRKIPVALQFPDWNNWLPDIHPFDAYGKAVFQAGAGGASDPWRQYQELVADANNLPASVDGFLSNMEQLAKRAHEWRYDGPSLSGGFPYKNIVWLGLTQWAAVKSFEVMHGVGHAKGNLQDKGPTWFHPPTSTLPAGEALTWPGKAKPFFTIAPHICCTDQFARQGPWETAAKNKFFSTLWYELQYIVQAGNRRIASNNPMDWKYHFGHINDDCEERGIPQLYRTVKGHIKMFQMLDNDEGVVGSAGWYLRHIAPGNWFSNRIMGCIHEATPAQAKKDLVEGFFRSFIIKTRRHALSEWKRGFKSINNELYPASYRPLLRSSYPNATNHADNIYMMTRDAAALGISLALVDSIATWGEMAWPLGNWEQWQFCSNPNPPPACSGGGSNPPPTVNITSPATGALFTAPATVTIAANASDPGGSVSKVEFFSGATKLGQDTSAPYRFNWTGVAAGSYTLTARATDNQGATATSAPVSIIVNPSVPSSTQNIGLQGGWNLVSSRVAPSQPGLEAVFAAVLPDIVMVKDELGRVFIPEFGINAIGDWDSKEAYLILALRNVTLTIAGEAIVPESTPLPLGTGWNMVPYLRSSPMAVNQALASIAAKLVLVKNNAGQVYIPEFGINTIGTMEPGQGYKIYVSSAATLTYPPNTQMAAKDAALPGEASAGLAERPAGIAASAILLLETPSLQDGDEIVVLTPERRQVGQGIVQQGRALITVLGDERSSEGVVEGARQGEALLLERRAPGGVERLAIGTLQDALQQRTMATGLHYAEDAFWVAQVEALPYTFSLEQNYPNPFNPVTTIQYALPDASPVRLAVYNSLGQLIAVLVDESQKAGVHEVRFDASRLASGLYLYRLKAGSFMQQKRMVLMK